MGRVLPGLFFIDESTGGWPSFFVFFVFLLASVGSVFYY